MRILEKYPLLAVLPLVWLLAACANEVTVDVEPGGGPATITVSIPEGGLTKVSLTQDEDPNGPIKTAWESTDVITVKNAAVESRSVDFTLVSGEGTKTAVFYAENVSKLNGASRYNIILSSNAPADYCNQTQASDGSTAHLGYVATLLGVKKYSSFTFSNEWALANGGGSLESSPVLRIRAQMPSASFADAVRKLTIKSSADIFDGSNELNVSIANPGVEGDGDIVTVYASLPAGNIDLPEGTGLLFRFHTSGDDADGYTAYREINSDTQLKGGHVSAFNLKCTGIDTSAGPQDDGSAENPYLIADRRQMEAMHYLLGSGETKYFRMVDDVNLYGITWVPLCLSSDENKKLCFDGGGHTIYNLTATSSNNYPSFAGFFWGEINDVVFNGASITCGNTKAQSGGVVSGYIGSGSHQGNCDGVTVENSQITSAGGESFVAGIAGRIGNAGTFTNCHVRNTSITSSGSCAAGLLSYIAKECTIADCSAENVTVTGTSHYAGGIVARIVSGPVRIIRCHSSGVVSTAPGSGRHVGGIAGIVDNSSAVIKYCYSSCTIHGYQFCGGLVGTIWGDDNKETQIDRCFASGEVSATKGNSGFGGLVGRLQISNVHLSNSIAWNGKILPYVYALGNYSSGAVVGSAHPNCFLKDNYRNPNMDLTAYWVPSADFDHPNVNGTEAPLVRIGTDLDESKAAPETTLTSISGDNGRWAYHGKHCAPGTTVTPDDRCGWISPDLGYDPDPDEDPDWTDEPTIELEGAETHTLKDGVEYIHFHGMWEGQVREINIIKTTLNAHNSLGVFYDYTTEGRKYLNEKCVYVGAVAGTNGSMACCQFVRVDNAVKHGVTEASYYTANCALTIDGGDVDIVQVNGNEGASMLPNQTVSCAGPLLVWKGTIQSYPEESTEDFLKTTHPRTAIGLSKDRKTVIQVTVDGRWTSSNTDRRAIGMSTKVLAKLMKGLGCFKAMNFDGGGGTQMWVSGYGDSNNIVNHPHNELPEYGSGTGQYSYTANPAARRTCGSAVYIKCN